MIERETTIAEVWAVAASWSVLVEHARRDGPCAICQVTMCWPRSMAIRSLMACGEIDELSPLRREALRWSMQWELPPGYGADDLPGPEGDHRTAGGARRQHLR